MKIILALSLFIAAAAAWCGQQNILLVFPFIVGGSQEVPGSWPWQANIRMYGMQFCGGTLIDREWVLTAAYCVYGKYNLPDYRVGLGYHHIDGTGDATYSQTSAILNVIVHPDYNPHTYENDIALLGLSNPVTFNDHIQPACLPDTPVEYSCNDFVITGWGRTSYLGPQPDYLQRAQVSLIDTATCKDSYGAESISDSMFCAGYAEGSKDTCQGDSGGPLVCKKSDGRYYVHGITSWGYQCASPCYPGVYTRVAIFSDWILNII